MCKVETDSAMGVKVLGLNVRIGGRDVMITIEEARLLYHDLGEALHTPIDPAIPMRPAPTFGPPSSPAFAFPSYPKMDWKCEGRVTE